MVSEDAVVGEVGNAGTAMAVPVVEQPRRGLVVVGMERHAVLAALMGRGVAGLAGEAGGAGGAGEEMVHDVRVATRRLGEVARVMGEAKFVDKPTGRVVEESLRDLRRAMGALRDGDVTREHLEKWKMPAVLKKVARGVAGEILAGRGELAKVAGELMGSASVQGAMMVIARVMEEKGMPAFREEAEGRLMAAVKGQMKRREKQMRRAIGRAAMKQTAESLHAARIAVKKLRYVMELAEAGEADKILRKELKGRGKVLKGMQELLGEHHDVHVIEAVLEGRVLREKVKGLRPAWGKWKREMEREQGRRAVEFMMRGYGWMNG